MMKSAQEQVDVNYTGGSHDETGFTRTCQKEKKTMFNFNTKRRSGKTNTILEFCKLKIKQ